MSAVEGRRSAAFAALRIPNYRLFFFGQGLSLAGTWMQRAALAWLVFAITGSSASLGFVVALQTVPIVLLAPYGGLLADRFDKRRIVIAMQAIMGMQALLLGLLTTTGDIRVWQICVLSVVLGTASAFENPARQAFIQEVVGRDDLRNAVTLNSVLQNAGRTIGPAIAGVLIALTGEAACFFINAASFLAVIASLVAMNTRALSASPRAGRARGQLREGLRTVVADPQLATPIVMLALVSTLAFEFDVSLPVMAREVLHAGPGAYGAMTAAIGAGAIAGGLISAASGRTGLDALRTTVIALGVAMAMAAVAPTSFVALIALALVGWGMVAFYSAGMATVQLAASAAIRGRVMAIWFVAFQGSTAVGAPVIGAVISHSGARAGLGVGAAACLCAALIPSALAGRRA